jgi:glycosyltransferase involved in cell wall biosynthesis
MHSLAEQTYHNLEVIVVDGGSTDGTMDIVDRYSGDGDIVLIELSPGLGLPKALNVGIAAAKGEFVARMDADDVAYPTRIADQVRFFATLPEVGLLGTGVDVFWARSDSHRSPLWHDHIANTYLINNPFFHPTVMFRRSLYDDGLFYYDETQIFEEDYELWGRLLRSTVCANMDKALLRYRVHDDNAQWDPRKHRAKAKALRGFCEAWEIADQSLIDALVEFQCSSFLRHDDYTVLRDYADRAERKNLPRLGWIHQALRRETDYKSFMSWYWDEKGWRL